MFLYSCMGLCTLTRLTYEVINRDTLSDFWGHPVHVMYTRPLVSSHKIAPGNEALGNHELMKRLMRRLRISLLKTSSSSCIP